jgi:hydroxymethylbilane synthase
MQQLTIGTRGSALALAQTELVKSALVAAHPGLSVNVTIIKTEGDRKQGTPQAAQSDKKDWIIDLERALLAGEIDLAVHSGKDVPAEIEQGTEIRSILKRANPFDVFIGKRQATGARIAFADLPQGAIIGTASLRRRASLVSYRSDLVLRDHRGNVPTRLQKLDDSPDLSGIVLAAAGLERLALPDVTYETLDRSIMLPAMNQGALAAQIRSTDEAVSQLIAAITDRHTAAEFAAERAVSEVLGGDCHSAISIFAEARAERVSVCSRVFACDSQRYIEYSGDGPLAQAEDIGKEVAQELLKRGGAAMLRR